MKIEPDFFGKMKAIFNRYPAQNVVKRIPQGFGLVEGRTFNVVKETEQGRKWVAFNLTIADVLRGLDGRYKDTAERRFHVLPA